MNGCLRAVGKWNLCERNFAFLFPFYIEVNVPPCEHGGQRTTRSCSLLSPWIAGIELKSTSSSVFSTSAIKPAPSQGILQVDVVIWTNVSGAGYFHALLTSFQHAAVAERFTMVILVFLGYNGRKRIVLDHILNPRGIQPLAMGFKSIHVFILSDISIQWALLVSTQPTGCGLNTFG